MKNKYKFDKNSNKGSVSLFVSAIVIFIAVIAAIMILSNNEKVNNQSKQLKSVKDNYYGESNDRNELEEEYQKIIEKDNN